MLKEKDVTITTPGRDQGKTFRIVEMDCERAEKWAIRALLAVAKSGVDLGDITPEHGMSGIAAAGIKALFKVDYDEISPLLDEMMLCVRMKPDPKNPDFSRPLIPGDIEEVSTRMALRKETLELHMGFSLPGAR